MLLPVLQFQIGLKNESTDESCGFLKIFSIFLNNLQFFDIGKDASVLSYILKPQNLWGRFLQLLKDIYLENITIFMVTINPC